MAKALARANTGDHAAFGEIVREYQAMVFSMAYYFLHDRSLAEETAQDVFLRLYRNLGRIKSPAHLMLWLRQVTNRRCIDQARRMPPLPPLPLEDAPEPTSDPGSNDPLLSERLRRMVASLPQDSRMVVVLRYQEELELTEIAEALEIPLNTVKSRLQRALAVLRDKVNSALEMSSYERPRKWTSQGA
ncbi:MAG: RNA polymerase sigma factor [Terriglobia bacterium]